MNSDNRIYRLTDESEIEALTERYGSKFASFRQEVGAILSALPVGVFVNVSSMVKKEKLLSAFIKCTCLFMLEKNSLSEYWEFDDHYLHIRHIKEDPEKEINYSAIQRWYGKK
ncbi:MAG: hypothetical protein KH586_08735 [Tannerella sp.]|jgi:hypothetical protein|nr:hypothetical protein [Tannerella sp.]DAW68886.1 MAG TPA: hypothetical protein [Bacteriophage sp.]